MTVKILSKEDILALHKDLINTFGGAPGVRDEGLLDSATRPSRPLGTPSSTLLWKKKPPVWGTD